MRPIDKGKAPETGFKKYQDAEPELEKRIGPYCSYCEMPIIHVPEVEHKEAKSQGGEELAWDNLLLTCKYCNTRKLITVKKGICQNIYGRIQMILFMLLTIAENCLKWQKNF